jgi:hypothetical protein
MFMISFFVIILLTADAFAPKCTTRIYNSDRCIADDISMNSSTDRGIFNDGNEDDDDDNTSDFKRISQNEKHQFEFIFDIEDHLKPENVHIILFNPNTDRQGAHTLEFPKGSGNNILLAFECEQECQEFSRSLKDQNFFEPIPQEVTLKALEDYCENIGVYVQVVPKVGIFLNF